LQRSLPSLLTTAACSGLRPAPDCRPRRTFLHLSYSYAPPCGPAMLVTQDPFRKWRDPSFDYRVGNCEQFCRHIEAECLGGLEVDHQLELDRGLHGKLAGLGALEDAIGIGRRAPIIIE